MRDRGVLYVGVLLIAFGLVFLLAETTDTFLVPFGLRLGWQAFWPLLVLLVGFAFWLPIPMWWDRRHQLAGLAVPGAIVTMNGLILLYQNLTGNWGSWSYLWSLEPMAVGVGLLAIYLLTNQAKGVLLAACILGGIGLVFFMIFASAFGGLPGILAPTALILAGILIGLRGIAQRGVRGNPEE
jgi:uncharacterized membrane protein